MAQTERSLRQRTTQINYKEGEQREEKPAPMIPIKRGEIVEMYSQLGDSFKDTRKNWPHTAIFNTISSNIIGNGLTDSMKEAISLGLEDQNHICCSCTVDCVSNKDCPCLKMAQKLKQQLGSSIMRTDVPMDVEVSDFKEEYWNNPRFVCGPRCACKTCSIKALDQIDKDHRAKFEIRRTDGKGFCLFTKKSIEKGTPLFSFNGEISGFRGIQNNIDALQYSMQFICKDDPISKIFVNFENLDKDYVGKLNKAYHSQAWINPLKKGNLARFMSHSCEANLEITRVFQGGLSPADIRIVLVSTRKIEVGEELFFNYGPTYVKEHLEDACLCSKCQREKENSRVSKRTRRQLKEMEEMSSEAKRMKKGKDSDNKEP